MLIIFLFLQTSTVGPELVSLAPPQLSASCNYAHFSSYSTTSNPSIFNNKMEASFSQEFFIQGVNRNLISFYTQQNSYQLGINLYSSQTSIEYRLNVPESLPIGNYSYSNIKLSFLYGYRFKNFVSIGLNLNTYYEQIFNIHGICYGFDGGITTVLNNFKMGILIKDYGLIMKIGNSILTLPSRFTAGINYRTKGKIKTEIGLEGTAPLFYKGFDAGISASLSTKFLSVYAGCPIVEYDTEKNNFVPFSRIKLISSGFSITYKNIMVSYAIQFFKEDLGLSNNIGMRWFYE